MNCINQQALCINHIHFNAMAGLHGPSEVTRNACRPSSSSQKTELEELRGLFYASACLTFPVFLFGMVFPMVPAMRPFLLAQIFGFPVDEIVKWMLVTPVQFYIGWRFHRGAWQALWNRRCASAEGMLLPGRRSALLGFRAVMAGPVRDVGICCACTARPPEPQCSWDLAILQRAPVLLSPGMRTHC